MISHQVSVLLESLRGLKLLDFLVYLAAWPVLYLISTMPPSWVKVLGAAAGNLAFFLDAYHRRICLFNLKIAFPHLRSSERWDLARRSFVNMSQTLFELPGVSRKRPDELTKRIRYDGLENYIRAQEQKKGVLLLTCHMGNWEFIGVTHGYEGFKLAVVARPLDNFYMERWLARTRCRSGNRLIAKHGALRKVHRSLREEWAVGLLMDQKASGADGVLVDFFGHPARSSGAFALLALWSGAPIIPVYAEREARGNSHIMHFEPEVPLVITGNRTLDILKNTERIQKVLQDIVSRHPEQWFWMHRRWRGAPGIVYPGEKRKNRRKMKKEKKRNIL